MEHGILARSNTRQRNREEQQKKRQKASLFLKKYISLSAIRNQQQAVAVDSSDLERAVEGMFLKINKLKLYYQLNQM